MLKTTDIVWIEAEGLLRPRPLKQGCHLVRASPRVAGGAARPAEFLRVHRGALVNVNEVRELQDAGGLVLLLSDGTTVPVRPIAEVSRRIRARPAAAMR